MYDQVVSIASTGYCSRYLPQNNLALIVADHFKHTSHIFSLLILLFEFNTIPGGRRFAQTLSKRKSSTLNFSKIAICNPVLSHRREINYDPQRPIMPTHSMFFKA